MIEYTIACQPNEYALMDVVEKALAEGWRLEGGVTCAIHEHPSGKKSFRIYQALSKIVLEEVVQ